MGTFPNLPRQSRKTVQRRRDKFGRDATPEPDFKIWVTLYKDINRFVNSVAHGLQTKVKYRSNQGTSARGLVLDSDPNGSLYRIHYAATREDGFYEGKRIALWCRLWRRKSDVPSERWAVAAQFERFWTTKEFGAEDTTATMSSKSRAERIIKEAEEVARTIHGDQGRRIRAWLALAQRKGFPHMRELWHYDERAVRKFLSVSWKEQEAMINRGGGFPLRGRLAGNWGAYPVSWRVYPFRELLLKYFDSRPQAWKLKYLDEQLAKSNRHFRLGKGAGGEGAMTEPTKRFILHLVQLARQPGNLYYESNRNTNDRRGILERL